MVLHLPCRLVACLHAVDGFAGGTLKTEERGLIIELICSEVERL